METRANFILIGAFTLAAILGTLGFFIWLASVQINRQYNTYGILFEDVSGLDPSGDVLFNGISVGKVIGLQIYDADPSKVFTTVEVDATTPVRVDTVAQLQAQGVTGVAYISLSGGTPDAPALAPLDDGALPIIPSRRSTVQTLVEDAPDLLNEATVLLEQFQALTGPENQAYVTQILRNLNESSGQLDQAFSDFSDVAATLKDATGQITDFTQSLDSIASNINTTLENADGALVSAKTAFDTADGTLIQSRTAIDSAGAAFAEAQKIMRDQVPEIVAQISDTVAQTQAALSDIQARTGKTIDGFEDTAGLLNARLTELEQTLDEASIAFNAVTEASNSFDLLVDGDGTQLVADARVVLADAKAAIATIDNVVINDVPAIMTDIRSAVATASDAVDRMAGNLTDTTDRFDPIADEAQKAITSATELFERGQTTLSALDATLADTQTTMVSAQGAFDTATEILDTDLAPVMEDVRSASTRISRAAEDLAKDMPAVAADLRALIARSDAVVAQVQRTVSASAPGINNFATTGLGEIKRLTNEARGLITTLNSVVRRIEKNPARFLLDDRVPECRR